MTLLIVAAAVYAVVGVYLIVQQVTPLQLVRIFAAGIAGGLLLAYTMGMLYFLIVLLRPAETIAIASIVALFFSAAYFAREKILGTITPLGIVFLNIALVFAPQEGRLPLSLAPLAALIPLPDGPVRIAVNLLVLYGPAFIALAALWRGPPGHPSVRFLLGVWVCYSAIAALAGPGWDIVSQLDLPRPEQWLAAAVSAYAVVHAAMLALNILFVLSRRDEAAAVAIARSVRIDQIPLLRAVALAAAFWIGMYAFMRLAMPAEVKAGIAIAVALALGPLFKSRPAPLVEGQRTADPAADPLVRWNAGRYVGPVLVFLVVAGGVAALAWRDQSSRAASWETRADFMDGAGFGIEIILLISGSVAVLMLGLIANALYEGLTGRSARRAVVLPALVALFVGYRALVTPLSPLWRPASAFADERGVTAKEISLPPGPTGTVSAATVPPDLVLGYDDAELQARLKSGLSAAGIAFETRQANGREHLLVAEEHRGAALDAVATIEGPSLPFNRSARYPEPATQKALAEWLTEKGVKWEIVTKRRDEYVVWEAVPGHECLIEAFNQSRRHAWMGIDFYAHASARTSSHCDLVKMPMAAFEAPKYRYAFLAWLGTWNVKPAIAMKNGREFIVWDPSRADLLQTYIGDMMGKCLDEYRAREREAQSKNEPRPINPCY